MDKEQLRQAFGQTGDFNVNLEKMFGKAYQDHPDTSNDNIPNGLEKIGALNVSEILGHAIEEAPNSNCPKNQQTILRFFKEHILGEEAVTYEEWFAVIKHMETCNSEVCHELYDVSTMDTYLSTSEIRERFNELANKFGLEKI